MNRRDLLQLLGLAASLAAVPDPVRRYFLIGQPERRWRPIVDRMRLFRLPDGGEITLSRFADGSCRLDSSSRLACRVAVDLRVPGHDGFELTRLAPVYFRGDQPYRIKHRPLLIGDFIQSLYLPALPGKP